MSASTSTSTSALIAAAGSAALLVGSLAGPFAQADIGATWTHQQELWSTSGSSRTDIGMAASGNGSKAVLMAAGRASDWTGSKWGKGKRIPHGDLMYSPDPQMSRNGKTVLATWSGDANEGVDDLYRAVRVGGTWSAKKYGAGTGEASLAANGRLGVSAWYEEDPDDGFAYHLYVSRWTGRWSSKVDLMVPAVDLSGHSPRVAVDDAGENAVVAWSQGGVTRVSFWDDGDWSAPAAGLPGRIPMAATFADGKTATVVTARELAAGQWQLERFSATRAGGIGVPSVIGTVSAYSEYAITVELNGAGTSGIVQFPNASVQSDPWAVATWASGSAFTVEDLGEVEVASAIARRGGRALVTTMAQSPGSDAAVPGVHVRSWDGTAWSAPKKIGRCADKQVGAALSRNGAVAVAGWTCSHAHAVRSPKPAGKVRYSAAPGAD